ncbi:HNH endonuclease signature motif containing protein [Methylocystis echinoides]|uniref:HNH endonuclease signature motif containing protein n=1 Tax=Methylocystis echinoides TaxID=29468 RepID=UPI00343AF46F
MCAYCSLMETEASAVRFTIDHYEPVAARPELKSDYGNLMYACEPCNSRKGDRYPPPSARAVGYRFFRPDHDVHPDHFRLEGMRLGGETSTGEYTIDALDLNRHMLRRLRELRLRKMAAEEYISEGVAALRRFHIDRLPPEIKGKVFAAIRGTLATAAEVAAKVDEVLRIEARSPLLGDDPDPDLTSAEERDRKARLRALEALFNASWRGRD